MRSLILLKIGLVSFVLSSAKVAEAGDPPFSIPANRVHLNARHPMDETAMAMLRRNGFVVLDSEARTELQFCYDRNANPNLPPFVTTDAMLHIWYELHRNLLRAAETKVLYPQISEVVASLLQTSLRLDTRHTDSLSRAALRHARVVLAVADCLLRENASPPQDLRSEVEPLVGKVLAHNEMHPYPGEDFTQYKVRGHYTERPDLSRYFRGSMWLSRNFFSVDPAPESDPNAPLRAAVAMAAIVRGAPEARKTLRDVSSARQFLAGVPNGISVEQTIEALDKALGVEWDLPGALHPPALAALRKELASDGYPKSLVWSRPTVPGGPFPQRVVALLPDFTIPDSILFQSTVNPAIPGRSLPTGLEVAAALGSEVAEQQIKLSDRQASKVLDQIRIHRPLSKSPERSIYEGWLHVLSTLFAPDSRVPEFMRNDAWRLEKTNTCLSSWAQLRHSYMLYGAQTNASFGGGLDHPIALVEPIPAFYRDLGDLVQRTQDTLARVGALPDFQRSLLGYYILQCRDFETYAEAELQGKLTKEQSERIANFGAWVDGFGLGSKPLVADVATGTRGEVLHAATGAFNPLIVIPDRRKGVAYVGWVMSYYEFSRPNLDRLSDEDWQKINASNYLRPERPEWTREFVYADRGERWQSRAPLREAERLLLDHKTEKAIALLRRTVDGNRDTALSTEAQLRIGQFYYDRGDRDTAQVELTRCRRMYGCEAWTRAEELLDEVKWGKRHEQDPDTIDLKTTLNEASRNLARLKAAALSDSERCDLERRVARQLLGVDSVYDGGERLELLEEAAKVYRDPDLREITAFYLLAERGRWVRQKTGAEDSAAFTEECLQASRAFRSPAFQAAALALALKAGLYWDELEKALALIKPYFNKEVFHPDHQPALRLFGEMPSRGLVNLETDPHWLFSSAVDIVRSELIRRAYAAGEVDLMMQYSRDIPVTQNGPAEWWSKMYDEFSDSGRKPLVLFARVNGLPRGSDPAESARKYYEVYRQFPDCRLAPYSLAQSAAAWRRAGDLAQAKDMEAVVSKLFPNTIPGLACCLRAAYEQGDLEATKSLLAVCSPELEAMEKARTLDGLLAPPYTWHHDMQQDLQRHEAIARALEPIAREARRPELMKEIPLRFDPVAVAEKWSAALPDRSTEIYVALLKAVDSNSLRLRFLDRFPNHLEATDVRWEMFEHTGWPDHLQWLVPFVNGPPGGKHFDEAWDRFMEQTREGQPSYVASQLAQVSESYPNTRAAWLAEYLQAVQLAAINRPEEASKRLRGLLPVVPHDDPVFEEAQAHLRRCELEVWAKRQREWTPLWTVKVGNPKKEFGLYDNEDQPITPPLAARGFLFVPVVDGDCWHGIVALDEDTGAVKWTAPLGPVCSLFADAAGRLVCGTNTGRAEVLDATTGKVLLDKVVDRAWKSTTYAVVSGESVVACSREQPNPSEGGPGGSGPGWGTVTAFLPATGDIVWQRNWRVSAGIPAVIGNRVFLALPDGKILGIDSATGAAVWENQYKREYLDQRLIPHQPVAVGGDKLIVRGDYPSGILDMLDATNGQLLASMSKGAARCFADGLAGLGFLISWERNSGFAVASLPELKVREFPAARMELGTHGVLDGNILYLDGDEVRAVEGRYGAVLAWWPFGERHEGVGIAVGKHVYVTSSDGYVIALPLISAPPKLPGGGL